MFFIRRSFLRVLISPADEDVPLTCAHIPPSPPPCEVMGVEDLPKLTKPDELLANDLEFLRGKTVAWDVSCSLHPATRSSESAAEFHTVPPAPITALGGYLDNQVRMFTRHGIKLIAATDGADHPCKLAGIKRIADARKKTSKLKALYRRGRIADYNALQKLRKETTRVRPDILAQAIYHLRDKHGITCVGAAFEAEWQCVDMARRGVVDAVYSVDSDCVALGSPITIMEAKWTTVDDVGNENEDDASAVASTKKKVVVATIVRREDALLKVIERLKFPADFTLTNEAFLALCCFLGNDYLYRIEGNGKLVAARLTQEWAAADAIGRATLLDKQNSPRDRRGSKKTGDDDSGKKKATTGKTKSKLVKKRTFNKGGGMVENYAAKFNTAMNLFQYCPVIRMENGTPTLVSMNPLPTGSVWKDLVGFDPIALYAKTGVTLADAYEMKESCRYGPGALKILPLPKHPTDDDRELPHGSVLDFEAVPPELTPPQLLVEWLWYRHAPMIQSVTHGKLIDAVRNILRIEGETAELREIRGDDLDPSMNKWVSFEHLACPEEGELKWEGIDAVLTFMRSAPRIDSEYINKVFGIGRNGVRRRGCLRVVSGHYNVEKMRLTVATLEASKAKVQVLEVEVTPSMKSPVYSVRLIFSDDGEFSFMPTHSECGCPNGIFFCSHMLGLLLLMRVVQKNKKWKLKDLRSFLPPPIKSMTSLPLSVQYVFGEVMKGEVNINAIVKKFGKALAIDVPGYTADNTDEVPDDMVEEQARLEQADPDDDACLDICQFVDDEVRAAKVRVKQRKGNGEADAKFSAEMVDTWNETRVRHQHGQGEEADRRKRRKAERHQAIHLLHVKGALPSSLMTQYVGHHEFVDARATFLSAAGSEWADMADADMQKHFILPSA